MAPKRTIRFLASVRSEDEALTAVAAGADVIDCKEPLEGALGALRREVVSAVRRAVPAHVPVSATIGDMPCDAGRVVAAAKRMAATGVDYVKIGLFPGGNAVAVVEALGRDVDRPAQLVAVLFADLEPDFGLIGALGRAGFAGVMLDTAGKDGGALPAHLSSRQLADFVQRARDAGLFAGLAGSLGLEHVAALVQLQPDILGFRGALCAGARRTGTLNAAAIRAIRDAVRDVPALAEAAS